MINFTDLLNSITLLGTKIKTKLALKLDKADIEGKGITASLDMTTGAGLALAQALPGALYNKGVIVGRARATEIGLSGPVATGNKTGLLKIYAEIPSDATGISPFNSIRREFSGQSGAMYVQYAVDATTWSAWTAIATQDGNVKSASAFLVSPNPALVGTPIDIAALGIIQKYTTQVHVRAADDGNITGELLVPNIADLDPLFSETSTDVGMLTLWTETLGNNATTYKMHRELLINGRTLLSSATTVDTTWGAWTLKREIANTIIVSTAAPSGGLDGDIWIMYS